MKFSTISCALLAPLACNALSHWYWSFPSTSGTAATQGLNQVTFGMNIANAAHRIQFYFAQEFFFKTKTGAGGKGIPTGYTGLQPQRDLKGKSQIRALFSSFVWYTSTSHRNCHLGADSNDPKTGVSCAVVFEGDYAHTYNLVVRNKNGDGHTWTGIVVDAVTGNEIDIGEWKLPAHDYTGIDRWSMGFVEDYVGEKTCADIPKSEVDVFEPVSWTAGAGLGAIQEPYQQKTTCINQNGFKVTRIKSGWNIKFGFK